MAHPALVQALLRPGAYPDEARSARVELVETHVSYLFLTGSYVYKVKKPVDYGFLDFTSLDRRRHFCHQEVLLNRRLSPEVYVGVVEVRLHGDSYAVEGPGETVEYAVQMRRLPRSQAMSELLRRRALKAAHMRLLAEKVHGFHKAAETGPHITALGGLDTVRNNVLENFAQTERYIEQTVSRRDFRRANAYSQAFLAEREDLFTQRAEEGRIRDGHGDLHSAQIFLDDNDVAIIDCIEFNERFRYGDVASDLAFLAMDLDYYRRDDLSRALVDAYVEASGDRGSGTELSGDDFSFGFDVSLPAPASERNADLNFRVGMPAPTSEGLGSIVRTMTDGVAGAEITFEGDGSVRGWISISDHTRHGDLASFLASLTPVAAPRPE